MQPARRPTTRPRAPDIPAAPRRQAARLLLRALLSAPRTAPGPSAATDLPAGIDRLHRERRRPGPRTFAE
ncbi:hypothetical protein GCM10009609_28510 [Pseudonocardia aurantiaca]